jgi:indole-3-glycerol phosphate synthase
LSSGVPDILARIVATKREQPAPGSDLRRQWTRQAEEARSSRRGFRRALESHAPAIIAEIKQASPSKGVLSNDFDPVRLARQYEAGGAAALSVLTDEPYFHGSLADLRAARDACTLPVLRKDFTLNEDHVLEAAAHYADAILLIAAILPASRIRELREAATALGLAALIEVHNAHELDKALEADAEILGVNNRDLNSFEVTLETSIRLAPRIPSQVLRVSESGIHSSTDVRLLRDAGYQAFLVGEHLMKASDPGAALRALTLR